MHIVIERPNAETGLKARREKRSDVRLTGTLKYLKTTIDCRVVNLSNEGMGLKLGDTFLTLVKGMPVTFSGPELGFLSGQIAWIGSGGIVGMRINHTTSSYAQVSSYFRFFHHEYAPTLKR